MLPKEHGAYAQLVFPLGTAFVAAGTAWSSLWTAVAVVSLFLAYEPLTVLRCDRARPDVSAHGRRAWWSLMACLSVATATAILAVDAMPASLRWSFAFPAVPASWLLVAILRRREKTLTGEAGVALACAATALPVCAAGGNPAAGAMMTAGYGLLFMLGTLAVRGIVLRTRGGGNREAARQMRLATLFLAALGTALVIAGATDGIVSWMAVAAMLPGVVFASVLAVFPPSASRLKRVGWSLVGVTAATAVLLVAAV